ncbi:hypothetical protein KKG31_06475 [Patescibacteria group bacterium]|nr:hypothetical protein [Patescibacteria group bacterium]
MMADFDRTLSKGFIAGQKSPSVIAQIRNGDYLSQEYVKKSHALFDHYHVIEIDHDIPKKEKMKEMHNWRKEHFVLLAESGLNEEILEEVIENKTLQFRENIDEFMRILEKAQIPLCIFSASIGDMIQAYLEQDDILTANTHIIANFLIYDEEGNVL